MLTHWNTAGIRVGGIPLNLQLFHKALDALLPGIFQTESSSVPQILHSPPLAFKYNFTEIWWNSPYGIHLEIPGISLESPAFGWITTGILVVYLLDFKKTTFGILAIYTRKVPEIAGNLMESASTPLKYQEIPRGNAQRKCPEEIQQIPVNAQNLSRKFQEFPRKISEAIMRLP